MATDDPSNPWSNSGWNVTAQSTYARDKGDVRAHARARDAGTTLGGKRPTGGSKPPAGDSRDDPEPQKSSTDPQYIILKKFFQEQGWSPVYSIVADGARRVLQIINWTGGAGTKPASGSYVGAAGLVTNIADAIDIRGATGADGAQGPAGAQGTDGAPGVPGMPGDDGADGTPGAPGASGAQGLQGDAGLPGPPGQDGEDGVDGSPGAPGPAGADGVTGTGLGFRADLNVVAQTGVVDSTPTKLNFTHEVFDVGGNYDAPNARWTPRAGLVHIDIQVLATGDLAAPGALQAILFKNGAQYIVGQDREVSQGTSFSNLLSVIDNANGTDYYEAYVLAIMATGTATISGLVARSWFAGASVSSGVQGERGPPGHDGEDGDPGPPGVAGIDGSPGAQGSQGIQGVQGPPGRDGDDGADGAQGPQGIQGDQGTAGAAGADGAAGATGAPGRDGDDGADGAQGPQGLQGNQGTAGNDGAAGAAGAIGPSGRDGDDGADGAPGPQGSQGPQGNQGTAGADGAAGVMGPPGRDGEDGADGPPGPQGLTGFDGVGVVGPPGRDGEDGIDGGPGPQGPQGIQGTQGTAGVDGSQGVPGLSGQDGDDGAAGVPGSPGAAGTAGADGATGPAGPPGYGGQDGDDGAPGVPGSPGTAGTAGAAGADGAVGPPGRDGDDSNGERAGWNLPVPLPSDLVATDRLRSGALVTVQETNGPRQLTSELLTLGLSWEATTQLIGFTPANIAEVETNTRALRTTLRPDDVTINGQGWTVGRYMHSAGIYFEGQSNTTTAIVGGECVTFHWNSTGIAIPKKVMVSLVTGGLAGTRVGTSRMEMFLSSQAISIASGLSSPPIETIAGAGGFGNSGLNSRQPFSQALLNYAAVTSGAAAGHALETNPVASVVAGAPSTAGSTQIQGHVLYDWRQEEQPIVLTAYRGFSILMTVPGAGTSQDIMWDVTIQWDEWVPVIPNDR